MRSHTLFHSGFGVINPHATRAPALPVPKLPEFPSSKPGIPKSSSPKCTTKALLAIEFSDVGSNVITSSKILTFV